MKKTWEFHDNEYSLFELKNIIFKENKLPMLF